jgi:hypothetical protein
MQYIERLLWFAPCSVVLIYLDLRWNSEILWMRKIDLISVPYSFKIIFFIHILKCFSISSFDKWTNGNSFEAQKGGKVRIFRKCLTPTPMNDTTVFPF